MKKGGKSFRDVYQDGCLYFFAVLFLELLIGFIFQLFIGVLMVGFHFFEGCVGVIVCSETVFGTFVACFPLTGRNSAATNSINRFLTPAVCGPQFQGSKSLESL